MVIQQGWKMAGEIFIARKQHDAANENPICLEEWLTACSTDPSLRVVSELSAVNPSTGEPEQVASNGCAFYMHPVQGGLYVFEYVQGKIAARYDHQVLLKAKELASRLGAILQDEQGLEIIA
ncbi:hypothetical protein [Undibacterium sp.]|uniref:hypothetical protein n=1 Tax=Undibacterium sp. TaxID=1914977 RepID=UPI00374DAD95